MPSHSEIITILVDVRNFPNPYFSSLYHKPTLVELYEGAKTVSVTTDLTIINKC
jgi:hypothetical protein